MQKNLLVMQEGQETELQSLGWEDPLEKGMASHFSILAWKIPWTEERFLNQPQTITQGGNTSSFCNTEAIPADMFPKISQQSSKIKI